MTIRVIGAGVGRTGTTSLQAALEILLNGRCYHMHEVFPRPDDIPVWHQAALGNMPDWPGFLNEFVAAVDWPASAFWEELAAAFPAAVIVLSTRDEDSWWKSASGTIFPASEKAEAGPWREMAFAMFKHRFTDQFDDREQALKAYRAHNDYVRHNAPPARLLEWQPGDGWEPLCKGLGIAVPEIPFPHKNTTEEFKKRLT